MDKIKTKSFIFQAALDEGTEGWGVRVERVEVYVIYLII